MDEGERRAAGRRGMMLRFGDDGATRGLVAACEVDVGGVVGGEREDGGFADAGGTCEGNLRWVSMSGC